jgi:glyoxylase I family protein
MEIFAGGSGEPKPEGAFFHVAFRTDNVVNAVEVAVAAGATVTVNPKDATLGRDPSIPVKIAFVKGPDGEIIEFFQGIGDNQL